MKSYDMLHIQCEEKDRKSAKSSLESEKIWRRLQMLKVSTEKSTYD